MRFVLVEQTTARGEGGQLRLYEGQAGDRVGQGRLDAARFGSVRADHQTIEPRQKCLQLVQRPPGDHCEGIVHPRPELVQPACETAWHHDRIRSRRNVDQRPVEIDENSVLAEIQRGRGYTFGRMRRNIHGNKVSHSVSVS